MSCSAMQRNVHVDDVAVKMMHRHHARTCVIGLCGCQPYHRSIISYAVSRARGRREVGGADFDGMRLSQVFTAAPPPKHRIPPQASSPLLPPTGQNQPPHHTASHNRLVNSFISLGAADACLYHQEYMLADQTAFLTAYAHMLTHSACREVPSCLLQDCILAAYEITGSARFAS